MRKETSIKISNLSFILSILIVLIHATTYAYNMPGSDTETIYGMNVSTFVQMFLAEGVCRVAVPMFFIFSGFLFFCNYEATVKGYMGKLKKRVYSLCIPYIFWNAIVFAFYYIAQSITITAPYFANRQVKGIGLVETLNYLLINPLNSPLWYLQNLIILAVLAPVIYWLIKKCWLVALVLFAACGCLGLGIFLLRGSAICAYCIGGVIGIHKERICECIYKFKKRISFNKKLYRCIIFAWGGVWTSLLIVKSIYLCSISSDVLIDGNYTFEFKLLSAANIIIGVPGIWMLYDLIFGKVASKWKACQYGMMLFVMHHPIVSILKKLLLQIFGVSMVTTLICYFVASVLTIALVIGISVLMKKFLPPIYRLVSGGR